jgi:DNA helicase-2/ATP-dependent DNA helicase PcrA
LQRTVDVTGYRDWLFDDGSEEGQQRAANVDELIVAAEEFDSQYLEDSGLERFLELTALVSDTDHWESDANFVTLMTLHAAKGLEFPVVFIVGLEDEILPHRRSRGSDQEIEEERRLLFVGITRGMQEVQLSRCLSRFRNGQYWPTIASNFLMELPRSEMQIFEPTSLPPPDYDLDDLSLEIDPWMHDGQSIDPDDWPYRVEEKTGRYSVLRDTSPSKSTTFPRLVTAAELAESQQHESIRCHPSSFEVGMSVEHADYGIGSIIAISGTNMKRAATVEFPGLGKKRFLLAYSKLEIVK